MSNNKKSKPKMLLLTGMAETMRIPVLTEVLGNMAKTKKVNWWIEIKRLPQDRIREILDLAKDPDQEFEDMELFEEVMVNWGELHTNEGEEVPFNEDNLWGVSQATEYKKSMVTAILNAFAGIANKTQGNKRKN